MVRWSIFSWITVFGGMLGVGSRAFLVCLLLTLRDVCSSEGREQSVKKCKNCLDKFGMAATVGIFRQVGNLESRDCVWFYTQN